ncbi:MAG: hypothetical protein LW688_02575, partial [Cryomorphaceae bacterium]|nr:hypothetical protein [Cryomorphaceae bacterium]
GANGCTDTESITITQDITPPTAGITNNTGSTVLTCTQTSIDVTATGGGTYSWSNSLGTTAAVSLTSAGTYTVTVTGANGCTDTESITITSDPSLPVAGITNSTGTTVLTCTTTSVDVTGTGGGTYSWSDGSSTVGSTSALTITSAGTYILTIQASNGCTDTETITITEDVVSPTAGITNNTGSTVLTCTQTSINVTATGGGTYSWSNSLGTTAAVSLTSAGTYTVTVTGANGCTDTESITITEDVSLASPTFSISQPTCQTPSGSITVTGPLGNNIQYSIGGPYQTSLILHKIQ